MKKLILPLILCLFPAFSANSQEPAYDSINSLAYNYKDAGNYYSAIKLYEQMAGEYPDRDEPLLYIADCYYLLSDFKQAVRYCNRTISKRGDYMAPAYNLRGVCLSELSKPGKALKSYRKCLRTDPGFSEAMYNAGNVYLFHKQSYSKAERYYLNAISLNPLDADYHYNLGLAEYYLDEHLKAILCMYYYLVLDSEDRYAADAFELIDDMIRRGYPEEDDEEETFLYFSDVPAFGDAELFLSQFRHGIENEGIFDLDVQEEKDITEILMLWGLFSMLRDSKEEQRLSGDLWSDFYIPFFSGIIDRALQDPFYFHISYGMNERAEQWLDENDRLYKMFIGYVNEYGGSDVSN